MPASLLDALAAWSLQAAALVGATAAIVALAAPRDPRLRLRAWQATLAATVLLPFAPAPAPAAGAGDTLFTLAPAAASFLADPASANPGPGLATVVVVVLALGALARGLWLWAGYRRLRARLADVTPAASPRFDAAAARLGADATLVMAGDDPPFTFGTRAARVVVPASLAREPEVRQDAVYLHELLHVRRGDWRWLLLEEAARTAAWFHPAVWILVAELRLAREEVVDREAAALLGSRRAYAEALLDFADAPRRTPRLSAALIRSTGLSRRLATLAREVPMSTARLTVFSALLVLAVTATAETARRAFPPPGQPPASGDAPPAAGPLEATAYLAPRDAAVPKPRKVDVPALPRPGDGGRMTVTVRVVVDAEGRVVERRVQTVLVDGRAAAPEVDRQVRAAVLEAARGWLYEAPQKAPLAFATMFTIDARGKTVDAAVVRDPEPIVLEKAAYPEAALKAGLTGVVQIEATIDETGAVRAARVLKSAAPELDEAALDAIRRSTFKPGTRNGEPVVVVTTIAMEFRLK